MLRDMRWKLGFAALTYKLVLGEVTSSSLEMVSSVLDGGIGRSGSELVSALNASIHFAV